MYREKKGGIYFSLQCFQKNGHTEARKEKH